MRNDFMDYEHSLAHYRRKGDLNKNHKYLKVVNGQYIYDTAASAVNTATNKAKELTGNVKDTYKVVMKKAEDTASSAKDRAQKIADTTKNKAMGAYSDAKQQYKVVMDKAKNTASSAKSKAAKAVNTAKETAEGVKEYVDSKKERTELIKKKVGDQSKAWKDNLQRTSDAYDNIKDTAAGKAIYAKNYVKENYTDVAKSKAEDAVDAAKKTANKVSSAAKSKVNEVKSKVTPEKETRVDDFWDGTNTTRNTYTFKNGTQITKEDYDGSKYNENAKAVSATTKSGKTAAGAVMKDSTGKKTIVGAVSKDDNIPLNTADKSIKVGRVTVGTDSTAEDKNIQITYDPNEKSLKDTAKEKASKAYQYLKKKAKK